MSIAQNEVAALINSHCWIDFVAVKESARGFDTIDEPKLCGVNVAAEHIAKLVSADRWIMDRATNELHERQPDGSYKPSYLVVSVSAIPKTVNERASLCLRPLRGCATDEQYADAHDRITAEINSACTETIRGFEDYNAKHQIACLEIERLNRVIHEMQHVGMSLQQAEVLHPPLNI